MKSTGFQLVLVSAALFAGCTPHPSSQPAPAGQVSAASPSANAPVSGQQGPPGSGLPGGPPGGPGRRPPNPMAQDTVRRKLVDSVLASIAGRENEPAGTVFKNVKVLKDMPAGEFVRQMDTLYGRALGYTCANCHVIGQYDGDTRKNKRNARDMQVMVNYINSVQLANMKELDEDFTHVSCATCHTGNGHPKNTIGVLPPPTQALPPLQH
jgi:hypothetical protein